MKRLALLALPIFTLFLASTGHTAGYGAAGCGLGSLVFGNEAGPVQIFASTTNGTFGSQTFGITSGTSNCDAMGIVLSEREDNVFVAYNFDSIKKEMATGEGEHLDTLSGLVGCPSEKGSQFASYTQQNYKAIFASAQTTPEEMLQAVKGGIASHPELATSCVH